MEEGIMDYTMRSSSDAQVQGRRCNIAVTVEIISGRWKAPILYCLLTYGTRRFGEIALFLRNEVTHRMLALELRELERNGLVSRHVYAEVPPRVEYKMTPLGQSLEPVLLELRKWGVLYQDTVTSIRGEPLGTHPNCEHRADASSGGA
jgi:DNA-binding HxlR family transcriptional regulator